MAKLTKKYWAASQTAKPYVHAFFLLFYHVPLKRYFFIELKAREFNYLDAGQRSFYITPVDQQLREFGDNPTIKEVEDKLEIQTAMQEIKSKEVIRKTIKKRS